MTQRLKKNAISLIKDLRNDRVCQKNREPNFTV